MLDDPMQTLQLAAQRCSAIIGDPVIPASSVIEIGAGRSSISSMRPWSASFLESDV